jgi:hypothetical protein
VALAIILAAGSLLLSSNLFVNAFSYPYSFSYDKECADRVFNKYLKDAEPEFDKYMDKADSLHSSGSPQSQSEVNDYLDKLNPLAQDYIDNPQPYAENYIDELGSCLG